MCSGLKPCWSGVGRRYLLIVGKSRDSRSFVTRLIGMKFVGGVTAMLRYRDN